MSLPVPKPGHYVHSSELGIDLTTYSYNDVPDSLPCRACVFHESRHAGDRGLCNAQPCDGIVWVDSVTYAKLRLTS